MPSLGQITTEQDQLITQAMERDGSRLRNYIRKHVLDREATEDILQEVFCELVEAYRLVKPIEQVSAWLFRVAKNRIVDRFRGRKLESLTAAEYGEGDDVPVSLEEMPEEQRSVFIAHEWEGYSFKELSAETGVSVNTLLSRKHYAVLHLRRRLQSIYEEFMKK